jgi:hypothetical protein
MDKQFTKNLEKCIELTVEEIYALSLQFVKEDRKTRNREAKIKIK